MQHHHGMPNGFSPLSTYQPAQAWYGPGGVPMVSGGGYTTPHGLHPQHPTPNRTLPYAAYPASAYSAASAHHSSMQKYPQSMMMPQGQSGGSSAVKISMPLMPNFTPSPVPHSAVGGGASSLRHTASSTGGGPQPTTAAATATVAQQRVNPISGKSLERDLRLASKDELIQVLLDVCACHASASSFVWSKAQLFSLRGALPHTTQLQQQQQQEEGDEDAQARSAAAALLLTKSMTPKPAAVANASTEDHNNNNNSPTKRLNFETTPEGSPAKPSRVERSIPSTPVPASRFAAKHTPAKAAAITRETRPFSTTLHPCLRLHGSCRHSTSCIFRSLPQNICLLWIRNSCAGGSDCGAVHRLPLNCPPQVQAVFDLSRGGDRKAMGERAQEDFQPQPWMLSSKEETPEKELIAEMDDLSPITPREQMTVGANLRDPRSGPKALEEDEDITTGEGGKSVARCLNESFELADA